MLIAEFMGAVKSAYGDYMIFTVDNPQLTGKINHVEILYHSSWDWLIPVIEKISKLSLPDPDGCSENWEPFPRTFGMVSDDTGNFMFRFNRHKMYEAPVLIDAAYSAVVDFLSGYCQLKGGERE